MKRSDVGGPGGTRRLAPLSVGPLSLCLLSLVISSGCTGNLSAGQMSPSAGERGPDGTLIGPDGEPIGPDGKPIDGQTGGPAGTGPDGASGTGGPDDPTGRGPDGMVGGDGDGVGPAGDGDLPALGDDDPSRPQVVATCDPETPYEAPLAQTYVARIKRLLTTDALTSAELDSVRADPDSLYGLIGQWLTSPGSDARLLEFFRTGFQQDEFDADDLLHQFGLGTFLGNVKGVQGPSMPNQVSEWIGMSFRESFARTALHLVRTSRPFTEVATTDHFMMNTPMMVLLAWQDHRVYPDANPYYPDWGVMTTEVPKVSYVKEAIPIAQTLDPNHANFMRFTYPADANSCLGAEDVLTPSDRRYLDRAIRAMFGAYDRLGSGCPIASNAFAMFEANEWQNWRWIHVRRTNDIAAGDRFYEVDKLRNATELTLLTPRVGFMTTPAFFAVWPTNADNSSRVTLNQTLITGLGRSIENSALVPEFDDFLDAEHAAPGTSCYGCHAALDPTRNFFRREFTDQASRQVDPQARALPATFAVGSMRAEGSSIEDFAQALADHPDFAIGWTQKLCSYATGGSCPDDPEFDRVVQAFRDSGYSFTKLLQELFSSPLVTGATCLEGGGGDAASVARRRYFCEAMSTRLGVEDACFYFYSRARGTPSQQAIRQIAPSIPDDTYSRGVPEPLMITDTNLFVSGAYERICETLAPLAVGAGKVLDPSDPNAAVRAAVGRVMAIPTSDTRYDELVALLDEHYASARKQGDANLALQSVFVLACLSPAVSGFGL